MAVMTAAGGEPALRLRQFFQLFAGRGVIGSVCSADYAPFFTSAVGLIASTCDDFVPSR